MKTVFINCSPKKRFCASAYFLSLLRLFTGGQSVTEKLRTPADHDRILEQLRGADALVFCLQNASISSMKRSTWDGTPST